MFGENMVMKSEYVETEPWLKEVAPKGGYFFESLIFFAIILSGLHQPSSFFQLGIPAGIAFRFRCC